MRFIVQISSYEFRCQLVKEFTLYDPDAAIGSYTFLKKTIV